MNIIKGYAGEKVMITGGTGFLGKHVIRTIYERGIPDKIIVPSRIGNKKLPGCEVVGPYDLTNKEDTINCLRMYKPDIIIHLAADVGGIGANMKNPAKYFYNNLMMGVNLIDASYRIGVEKFIQVGTICSYPVDTPVPFKESDLYNGYPEITNAPYGIAKKALLTMLQAYELQYGFNWKYLLPVNLYGPGDNFDLQSSHVIPALIRKFLEAKDSGVEIVNVWGTGEASREFLYVEDCAEAIALAATDHNNFYANIGTGREIKIKDLVSLISDLCDYKYKIEYDKSKPDGQPRRCLDVSKLFESMNWTAETKLEDGLRKTIKWYKDNKNA